MGFGFGFANDTDNTDALFEGYIRVVPEERVLEAFEMLLQQDEVRSFRSLV